MTIYCKFVKINKEDKLEEIADIHLSEAFLPIIGDSVRLPTHTDGQLKVVDRHFWIEEPDEKITIYVQEVDSLHSRNKTEKELT